MKKIKMSKLAKMVKERTASALPDDEQLKQLEDKILDAIEPVLLKEKIADNRMIMAGAVMKAAMLIYHADLGDHGTAMLMQEVGEQVAEGLLNDFYTTNPETIH